MSNRTSTHDLISSPDSPRGALLVLPVYPGATWRQSQRSPPPSVSQNDPGAVQAPPLLQRRELGSETVLQLPEATQRGRKANSAFDMETEAQREGSCSVTACEQIPAGLSLFPQHQGQNDFIFLPKKNWGGVCVGGGCFLAHSLPSLGSPPTRGG